MPEAVSTDLVFTISLKRSTQNLQLSTSWPADYPIFYLTQGYFDIAGIEKPLLHTWTLSVEEQFYFVAPVLLLAIFQLGGRRFGHLAILIGLLLGAVSLIGAITEATSSGRNAAFYLPRWRGWEFLASGFIGGQLVAAVGRVPRMAVETTA